MIDSQGETSSPGIAAGTLPDGLRIYAVGDIHGRFDLLEEIATSIRRDLRDSPSPRAIEIFLGDYVDRGPQSREVIEWLLTTPPLTDRRICLMGNHEDMLLEALRDPAAVSNWLFNGGAETIASYRKDIPGSVAANDLRGALIAALPENHRAFFQSLSRTAVFGSYLFVHAGIRPGVPLAEQDPHDLVWIREPFHHSDADHGFIVVHGHTPVTHPDVRRNRINIDTGAVFTGRLTCLVLEGATRRFIDTRAGSPVSHLLKAPLPVAGER